MNPLDSDTSRFRPEEKNFTIYTVEFATEIKVDGQGKLVTARKNT